MPIDTKRTVPVLIHVNPRDWAEFKTMAGTRRASLTLRKMIRAELRRARMETRMAKITADYTK